MSSGCAWVNFSRVIWMSVGIQASGQAYAFPEQSVMISGDSLNTSVQVLLVALCLKVQVLISLGVGSLHLHGLYRCKLTQHETTPLDSLPSLPAGDEPRHTCQPGRLSLPSNTPTTAQQHAATGQNQPSNLYKKHTHSSPLQQHPWALSIGALSCRGGCTSMHCCCSLPNSLVAVALRAGLGSNRLTQHLQSTTAAAAATLSVSPWLSTLLAKKQAHNINCRKHCC